MTPHEWECVFDRTRITFTDLWLIFFNKISVEYKVERQESDFIEVSVKFKASNICCIPFSSNNYGSLNAVYCNAMSYLDFNTVSYHSFKTVATKGWNRNKYSHLLFIHQSSSSDKGGFLIGVQYEKMMSPSQINRHFLLMNLLKKRFRILRRTVWRGYPSLKTMHHTAM